MIPLFEQKINRKVRVFISSTFSDMQGERNIIVHSVFPRLRKAFSSRMIDITEVDLRWGIPEEDSESSRILEICIGEVLHCSPFFVGMVGDRYGSLASDEAIEGLPPAYRKALGEELPAGLSITELEMRAGVFVPKNADFSCFFIKSDILNDPTVQPEVVTLISHITDSYEMHPYTDLQQFEEKLYQTLYDYILKMIPDQLTVPYRDKSYFSHMKLLKSNTARYDPDNILITRIERKINQYRRVYVYGKKGMGKSACLSYLIKNEGIVRDGKVFFHYAAAGSQSINLENVFFRLRLYLQAEFNCTSSEEDHHSAVIDILKSGAVGERVVFFFDAMDQLDDVTAVYKFFALADLNPHVHVVCSGAKEYSRITGEYVEQMKPLSADQISHLIDGMLSQHGKKLSRRMKQDILKTKNCENPLFLRAFLSQIIMYGTYATFEEFFYQLLRSENFGELFAVVIGRVKEYFQERGLDGGQVYQALALMVYSNNGVKESEIQEILDILPVARSVLFTAIDLFTIENNGLIRFNHDLIIRAAKAILKDTDEAYDIMTSELFIKYFSGREDDWRKYSEFPYQLCQLHRFRELQAQLSVPECFVYLSKYEFHTLIGYLSNLVDSQEGISAALVPHLSEIEKIRAAEIFCLAGCHKSAISIVSAMLEQCEIPDTRIRLMDILARSQYKLALGAYHTSIATYHTLLTYFRSVHPDDETGYAARAYLLGVAYGSAGQLTQSAEILRNCAEIYQRNGVVSATSLWVLDVYGEALYTDGKIKKALEILDTVISECTYLFGEISAEQAWAYCYGWNTLYAVGDKTDAIDMVHKAYEIFDGLYLGRGSKIAWAASNVGTAEMILGNCAEAERHYLFSISENDCILPEADRPHVYSLTTYADLAVLFEKTNRHERAVEMIEFALAQSRQKNGETHIYTYNILLSCGIIEKNPGMIIQAFEGYAAQTLRTPDIFFAQMCLARIYVRCGQPELAQQTIHACAEAYFAEERETDLITYLILDSMEKISGAMTDDQLDQLDGLYWFADYDYYLTHNNNSQIIMIPKI